MKSLSILIVLCCLGACTVSEQADGSNFMVVKNDKVIALSYYPTWNSQDNQANVMWIYNDQQSITVELNAQKQDGLKQQQLLNHNQYLPIWSSLIKSKGYLKPYTPFNGRTNHMLKGYRYTKPAYHDSNIHETYEQIQAFIKTLIQLNNLISLNLRMEDKFVLKLEFTHEATNITNYIVKGIQVKYLFATVTKDIVPQKFLQNPQFKVIRYDLYLIQSKFSILERKLSGRGLHQWINHTITLDDVSDIELQGLAGKCYYEFTDILPESTYIDSDQRRQKTTNYEIINIERPAFASKQYFYKYRVPLTEMTQSGVRKYTYSQPIHFRFPSPSMLNYTRIYLHPIVEARIICNEDQENGQGSKDTTQQITYKLQENLLFERGTAKIPNADITKSKIVSITSLVVCLIAVLVIIKKLRQNMQ